MEDYYIRTKRTNDTDSKIKMLCWKIVDQYLFKTSPKFLSKWRIFLLKLFGAKVANDCFISPYATITRPWDFEMGHLSAIDDYCYIIPPVVIGDKVSISNNCHVVGGGHNIWSREFEQEFNAVTIRDGAFIGAGVYVSMGCKIGVMSVIAPHINIRKNIPDNKVVSQLPNGKMIIVDRIPEEEFIKYKYNY